jgi:hypothetical protein
MLIVLAIIGVMSSIVWPAASNALDSIRLRSAADSVASLIARAAIHVERKQQPVELIIDPEAGRLSVAGAGASDNASLTLDEGVTIAGVEPRLLQEPGAEEQPELRRFVLMPGAGWPALKIQLESTRHARRVVSLDPITGSPSVSAAGEEENR